MQGNARPDLRSVVEVPVLEAQGEYRVGRFGWKNQQASLLSFSADAYLNEMGITAACNLMRRHDLRTVKDPKTIRSLSRRGRRV